MSSNTTQAAFVRKYNPTTDLDAVIHIFRETCDESLKVEPIWTIGSYIWCRPYLILNPDTCLVVDDGKGTAVGYVLGTIHSGTFCRHWLDEYLPQVDQELQSLPPISRNSDIEASKLNDRAENLLKLIRNDPRKLVLGAYSEHLEHLGHLHIDILPSFQRRGLGKQLIDELCFAMKEQSSKGLYLGMVASNHGAASFYEACGFKRLPAVLDNGTSGELGKTGNSEDGGQTIYFVIDFSASSLTRPAPHE